MGREHDRPPAGPRAPAPVVAPAREPPLPGVSRDAALARRLAASRSGLPNRRLARYVTSTLFLPGPSAPSLIPPAAQRGPNPADGIAAVTKRLLGKRPASAAALRRAATGWADAVVVLIGAGAAGSGAPHAQAIAANEADEIPRAVSQILDDYFGPSAGRGGGGLRDCHADLLRLAARKEREVRVQFHHGVIVETDDRGWFGYAGDEDLRHLDMALGGLPEQHVWNAPDRPLRFRRQMLAPGGSSAGGETDPTTSTITLYSSGMQAAPYTRSAAIGLPGFEQTIRHEIGHTVEHRLTPAARDELFRDVLGWRRYSWHWITTPNAPYPTWREERAALARETGLEGADLDAWLAGFTLRTAQGALARSDTLTRGSRSYVRSATQGDHLHSIRTSELPQGEEFDYALTEHNDYLSELYAFALSRPFWLATKISPAQKAWWRRRVFGTPGTDGEILRVAGMAPDAQMRFAALVPGLFTWPQISQAVAAAAVPENVA